MAKKKKKKSATKFASPAAIKTIQIVEIMRTPPTRVTISRNGTLYTFAWAQPLKYVKQMAQYSVNYGGWQSLSVSAGQTKITVGIGGTYGSVRFRVRGKVVTDQKGWTDWAMATFMVGVPGAPSLTYTKTAANAGTFSWAADNSATSNNILVRVETITRTNGGAWSSPSAASASGSWTSEENLGSAEYCRREFAVRSVGMTGCSGWVYAGHTYCTPNKPTNEQGNLTKNGSTYWLATSWNDHRNEGGRPVDKVRIEWGKGTPSDGKTLAAPDGMSLSTLSEYSPATTSTMSAGGAIDYTPAEDSFVYFRVVSEYEERVSYGDTVVVGPVSMYRLKKPTIGGVEVDTDTGSCTVSFTNNSGVPDSWVEIYYRTGNGRRQFFGSSRGSTETTITGTIANYANTNVYAFSAVARCEAGISSDFVDQDTTLPSAPSAVSASENDSSDGIIVRWNWTWSEADGVQLAWADHSDAWESTDEPSTYNVTKIHASRWTISGLDTGKKWYIRVRYTKGSGDATTYGPWSRIVSVDLTSAPAIPSLEVTPDIITEDGHTTATWAYMSTDGTAQAGSEICEATVSADGIAYGNVIARTSTLQHIDIYPADLGWTAGTSHFLAVRVISASGRTSDDWSPLCPVTIAPAVTAAFSSYSLVDQEVSDGFDTDGNAVSHNAKVLTDLPLKVTVDTSFPVTVSVIRAIDFPILRPDNSMHDGFAGEVIASAEGNGGEEITITKDDLLGNLDDDCRYYLTATAHDDYGQYADCKQEFEVHFSHQPVAAEVTVEIDEDDLIAKITAAKPDGAADTDTIDIYRLSTDLPELIVKDGSFGVTYVDPYPAFGEYCGHRVVVKTASGDYKGADDVFTWTDTDSIEDGSDILEKNYFVVDFGAARAVLPYNLTLDNSWKKDFESTSYLGGSVVGDWGAAVTRDLSVNTDSIIAFDIDTIRTMRALAEYTGICHVRTPDGSSFAADVEVTESRETENDLANYSLSISRVESEGLDGMTLEMWEALQAGETTT